MFDFLRGYAADEDDSPIRNPENLAEFLKEIESRKHSETDRQFNLSLAKAQAGINLEVFRRHHAITSLTWAVITVATFGAMLLAIYISNAFLIVGTALLFVAAVWYGEHHGMEGVGLSTLIVESKSSAGEPKSD